MSFRLSAFVAVLSFTIMAAGCSKKSSKGPRAAGKPAAVAPATEVTEAPKAEVTAGEEIILEEDIARNDRPARINERERPGIDDSRRAPAPEAVEGIESGLGEGEADGPEAGGPGADTQAGPNGEPVIEARPEPSEANGVSRNSQCGTAYRRNTEQWAPGLPNAPSPVKICTGGTVKKAEEGQAFTCENNPDLVFTDARQDGLMAHAVEQANRVPKFMDQGSRELARRIREVKIDAGASSREVRAQVQILVAEKEYEKFDFRGVMQNGAAGIRMIPLNSPRGLKFNAVLTCVGIDGSCDNVIFRLQQLTRTGKVGRIAYIVIRSGDAHVTISERDRIGYRTIENKEHAQFAEFLSNTTYNTCVSVMREVVNGQRQLPTCAYQRMKAICGKRAQFKRPAAEAFEFRSWAVAYGRSGFEFEMVDRETPRFVVKGPLVAGNATPIWPRALNVHGAFASSIDRAILVANDGGGNLNLQIDFKGGSNAHTRISVTTLIEDVRNNPEATMARARQMPALAPGDTVNEEEMRDDEREERGEPRREMAPQVLPPAIAPVPRAARAAAPATRPLPPRPAPKAKNAQAAKPASAPQVKAGANPPAAVEKPSLRKGTARAAAKPAAKNNAPANTEPGKTEPAKPAVPVPAPATGTWVDVPKPAATPGVPAREKEDNQTVQPRDGAPQTPPPDANE